LPPPIDPKYWAADGFKRCNKCEQVQPVSEYYEKKGTVDGYAHPCKTCTKAQQRRYYEANQEKKVAYSREWHRQNPEKAKARSAKYRERIGRERQHQRWISMTPEERAEFNRRQRAARAANPERFRLYDLKRRLKKFGVTLEEYNALLELQGGVCAICQGPPNGKDPDIYHVDHDHETGKLRGLLCSSCNNGLGCFRDNTDSIQKALAYLADPPFRRIAEGTLF